MGKRELLILLVFAVLGAVVYRLTATPAPAVDGPGVVEEVLAHVGRERHQVSAERTAVVDARGVTALHVGPFAGTLTVVGSDRADVSATLVVPVAGRTEDEARERSASVSLALDHAGDRIEVRTVLGTRRQVPAKLTVALPRHYRVTARVEGGDLRIEHVAAATIDAERARVTVSDVAESVRIEHRDGAVAVENVRGAVGIESRRGALDVRAVGGPLTITHRDGPAHIAGLGISLSYDGRRAPLTLSLERAVEIDANLDAGDLALDLPATIAVNIDAYAANGQIEVPAPLTVRTDGRDRSVEGVLGGGGPSVRLRTRRGAIVITQRRADTDGGL